MAFIAAWIRSRLILFALLAFFSAAALGADKDGGKDKEDADDKDKTEEPSRMEGEKKLSIAVGGKTLDYTIKTSLTPIFDKDDNEIGHMFSTSYVMERGERERPVMFLFNGGPGSASVYLHTASVGPKVLSFPDKGLTLPPPPYRMTDNPDTILDVADLVFLDPIGTGFSRSAVEDEDEDKKDGDKKGKKKEFADMSKFWGVEEDIDSVCEFIRIWLTENDRWGARVFIAGESYGGVRAAGLASALEDVGIAPSGIVLVSPAINYRDVETGPENIDAHVALVPGLAATAWYHGRLTADLQAKPLAELVAEAERWSLDAYLPGLWAGNRLPRDKRDALAADLARYTGLPPAEIKAHNLMLSGSDFNGLLLRDDELFLSLYDSRLTGPGVGYRYSEDPSFVMSGQPIATAFMRHLNETLGLKPTRSYNTSSEEAFRKWDFTLGARGLAGYVSTASELAKAMRRLPFLKVYLATGRYDVICPPESALQSLSRMNVPADRMRANIASVVYEGGHMMYTNPEARKQLAEDLRAWIRGID